MTTPERLVESPVFLLSPIRSGSTLLRCLLGTHSQVCAPHELHLRYLSVGVGSEYTDLALSALDLDGDALSAMLWDRLLHALLTASGKRVIVDKSPSNLWIHERLRGYWPHARFIFLRRDPAAVVDSIVAADDGRDEETATAFVADSIIELDRALAAAPGSPVVRYEDLVADPGAVCRSLCSHLGLAYEPSMLDYGAVDHGPYRYGIGDWGEKIRTGRVQPARPVRTRGRAPGIARLRHRWGYPN